MLFQQYTILPAILWFIPLNKDIVSSLKEEILEFIHVPNPLWGAALARRLYDQKMESLINTGILSSDMDYLLHKFISPGINRSKSSREVLFSLADQTIWFEEPDMENLDHFHQQHGLELLSWKEVALFGGLSQFSQSMRLFSKAGDCAEGVATLCKSVHFLSQPEPEYDISYSHPDVPFSIFVSIGNEQNESLVYRLSESILHESMHLKLSLIESHLSLVDPQSEQTFYSPWRGQQRPARGVLHGMFVFRAVLDFYILMQQSNNDPVVNDFIDWRIECIMSEMDLLIDFPGCSALTPDGATLAANLLPLN